MKSFWNNHNIKDMADLTLEQVTDQLTAILEEAFEHPSKPWSYFTDPSPDAGYFAMLEKVTAIEANQSVGANSIAAQVNHITFGMKASMGFIKGDPNTPSLDQWQQSWQVPELTETTWKQMQVKLREAYHQLQDHIRSHAVSRPEAMGVAVGTIAHAAYHLGAIKQKINICGETNPTSQKPQ